MKAVAREHVWLVNGGSKAGVLYGPDRGQNWEVYFTPIVEGGRMTGIFPCDFFDATTGIAMGGV